MERQRDPVQRFELAVVEIDIADIDLDAGAGGGSGPPPASGPIAASVGQRCLARGASLDGAGGTTGQGSRGAADRRSAVDASRARREFMA